MPGSPAALSSPSASAHATPSAAAARPGAVAITGASGLIGSHLAKALATSGTRVLPVHRRGTAGLQWRPEEGLRGGLDGAQAVVHLAGATIGKRWTARRRRLIRDSRVPATRRLCEDLAALDVPPRVLVCASAVGYYGDRDEPVDEQAPPGEGLLAELVQDWEAAADPARDAGIRVTHVRSGVVLSPAGGALPPLLRVSRLGLAGPIGRGTQWFAWIAIEDEVRAIQHVLSHDLAGPVNLVSPGIVTQREFARALARQVHRPAVAPLPGFAVRALFGQMGEELFLFGQRAVPRRLQESGFEFAQPQLEGALRALLG